ncbi:MAG TPA: cytochrome c [Pyrinomonadaceae bacterium]|nr:cytochrome c [Pyrinomonadaceae bacterium]
MFPNSCQRPESNRWQRKPLIGALLVAFCMLAAGCGVRLDMQDQPRYKVYRKSDFFADRLSSREHPQGTVARGLLKENKALYTGQIDNPNLNAQVETTTNAAGNTIVTSFPNAINEFPIPVTKELVDRGQERYNIYCIVCHGPVGAGDGMIVRRGFGAPPTYHDDRLRNAPVGHFFDVITNGWGKMNGYSAQIAANDRWAIVAYIRALQISQDPEELARINAGLPANGKTTAAAPASNDQGGAR